MASTLAAAEDRLTPQPQHARSASACMARTALQAVKIRERGAVAGAAAWRPSELPVRVVAAALDRSISFARDRSMQHRVTSPLRPSGRAMVQASRGAMASSSCPSCLLRGSRVPLMADDIVTEKGHWRWRSPPSVTSQYRMNRMNPNEPTSGTIH
jgi:hypothetical protein